MLPYIGSGDYCYANSLYMSLLGSGANPDILPSPGFLECLTTMPFGNTYLSGAEALFLRWFGSASGINTCDRDNGMDLPVGARR